MNYYYDLHIHSVLSPCAESDMTPNNIVNMAVVNGLDVIGVTDHNSARNLAAISRCAEKQHILFIPGIEVETVEEVHVVCMFSSLGGAEEMGRYIESHLPDIPNNEDIFGVQQILDDMDNLMEKQRKLLIVSTDLTIDQVMDKVEALGGAAYFAHVDRKSYGVLATLGTFPDNREIKTVEVSSGKDGDAFLGKNPQLKSYRLIRSSDSHQLNHINHKDNYITIEKDSLRPEDIINYIKRI
ncbi:MAG: PHP domain-containing protein [Anaerovoracaceae bacterium]